MCLTINMREHEDYLPKTAHTDIVVYKIVKPVKGSAKCRSVFKDFEYWPNTMYRLRQSIKVTGMIVWKINRGFHSYVEMSTANVVFKSWSKHEWRVCKFIIPKGAKYYLGMDGDVVSTSIVSGSLRPFRASGSKSCN